MTEQASKEASPPAGALVRDLFEPSPSLRFELERKRADGSVETYPFRCRLLRVDQIHDAILAAQKYAKDRGELKDYGDIYREAMACELLQRAIVQEEMGERVEGGRIKRWYRPMFVDTEQLRRSLDEAECAQLLNCYELTKAHFRAVQPYTEEEVEDMLDSLADAMMGPYFLGRLDSADWPHLIFVLARLARSWRPSKTQTPSDSLSSSESDPSTSDPGTTTFSELPVARSVSTPSVPDPPTDRILTREEAREIVKRQRGESEE